MSDDLSLNATNRQLQLTVDTLYARLSMLQATLDSLQQWIAVKDPAGRYVFVNKAFLKGHRAKPEEILRKTSRESPRQLDGEADVISEMDAQVLAVRQPLERERYVVRMPDGAHRMRRLVKAPLEDSDGDLLGVVGWSEDITDRVRAEEALETNRNVLRAVIDVVPYPLSYIDADFRLMMVNPAWCELLGCKPEDVEGLSILEIDALPTESRDRMYADNIAIMESGAIPPAREYSIIDAAGRTREHLIAKAAVRSGTDKPVGIVTIAVDVTDLKHAEQRASLAHQRLVDALDIMPAAVALYDNDRRLNLVNSTLREWFPYVKDLVDRHAPWTEVIEEVARHMPVDEAERRRYLKSRLRDFDQPRESFEMMAAGGRQLLARDRHTSEGGMVSVRFDITELKRIQQELEQREMEMRADLAMAAEVQRSILRPLKPPGFLDLAVHFHPSSVVSGDVYHGSLDRNANYNLFLGDATGHGVAAAFMSVLVESELNNSDESQTPVQTMERLNGHLAAYKLEGRFVTGIGLSIDPAGRLSIAHAGHPPALLLRRGQGSPVLLDGASGFPLGWFDDSSYEAVTLQLEPGDRLLLYTDGILEWVNPKGVQFGQERLLAEFKANRRKRPEGLLDSIVKAAHKHAQGNAVDDDVSMIVLDYRPRPANRGRRPTGSSRP